MYIFYFFAESNTCWIQHGRPTAHSPYVPYASIMSYTSKLENHRLKLDAAYNILDCKGKFKPSQLYFVSLCLW
jgi:hypothetical protein